MARSANALLLLLALTGCNAILGMERATLDENASSSGSGGGGGSDGLPPKGTARLAAAQKRACAQQNAACTDCLKSCSGYDACISDDSCRTSIDAYAYCLGKTCSGDAEQCLFGVENPTFNRCISTCSRECAKSALVSTCDLYCGCMGQFCDGYLKDNCMQQCQTLTPEIASCRRDHCEYSKGGMVAGVDHCLHASGAQEVCANVGPPMEPSPTCVGYQLSGWACNSSDECCTKSCLDGKCM